MEPPTRAAGPPEQPAGDGGAGCPADVVTGWVKNLGAMGAGAAGEAEATDLIASLETLKSAAAAAQARASVTLDEAARRRQAEAGLPAAHQGRGVAAQVALARRDSPALGSRHLGLAKALVREMPHTHAALSSGALSEWRATLICRETACLSVEDRAQVDREMCADPADLEGLGNRRIEAWARRIAYRLDPEAAVARTRKATADRRVTCRPAPDTMSYLNALLPVAQGVACFAVLDREAKSRLAAGDARSRGQLMADVLVERLTGQATAEAVPMEIELVITDHTLLGRPGQAGAGKADEGCAAAAEPGSVPGYGPVPAGTVHELVVQALANDVPLWVRRLYAEPTTGQLVALESVRRRFPDGLARFLRLRDGGTCRSSWCDAPIRHYDHVVAHAEGGPTSAADGQGVCEACNHAKQAPDWWSFPIRGPNELLGRGRPAVVTGTPTGHTYRSQAPPLVAPSVDTGPAPPGADGGGDARMLRLVHGSGEGPRLDVFRTATVRWDEAG